MLNSKPKKIFFENLDGLRFLCFLSVFFFHSFYTKIPEISESKAYTFIRNDIFGNGNIGVNFFFVLSGFLITFLLIQEKRLNGQINLKYFWIRRILRIWPLFYFCVFFGFAIFPLLKRLFGEEPNETAGLIYYLTFTNNFDFIKKGLPDASILGVLWSVAIEEQFYLVWPVIIYFFPINKLWIPFIAILSISLIYRALNDSHILHEHHTLSCIGDMTIGATSAWLISISKKFKAYFENINRLTIAMVYSIFIICYFFRQQLLFSSYGIRIFERTFLASIIAIIILEQIFSKNSILKMSRFKRVSELGKITYGLYCLHFIGILIALTITRKLVINVHLWQVLIIDTFLALTLTIIISKLSYRYFEAPFLKLKEKFSFLGQ